MIVLSDAIDSLQISLSGSITTTQLEFFASYHYISLKESRLESASGATNDTTSVIIVQGTDLVKKDIGYISVYNKDSASAEVTIKHHRNKTSRTLTKVTVASGYTLEYSTLGGWKLIDASGKLQTSATGGGGGGSDGGNFIAAGTRTADSTGTVIFSNANGLTFGLDAVGGSVITVNHALQFTSNTSAITAAAFNTSGSSNFVLTVNSSLLQHTSATSAITSNALHSSASRVFNVLAATNSTGGGTASLSSNVSFSNANGATFYTSAGGALALSYSVPTVTNSSFSVQDSATTINPVARIAFSTGNNITLSLSTGASSATVGVIHNLAGTSTGFGGNLISASMTHNSSGLNLSLNHPAWLTTARASTDGIGLNTAQTNVTWTVNSSGLSLNAAGYAGTGTTFNGANMSGSITQNSNGINLSLSVAAPGAAAEANAINLIGNNTTGNTTASGSTIGWAGVNGITLSGSNNSQISIIGDARTISGIALNPIGGLGGPIPFGQSSISLGQNSLYIYPFELEDYLTCDQIRMPVLVTCSSSAAASVQKGYTYQFGIYTRNATNATVLSRHYSTSYTLAASHNSNVSWAISIISAFANSTSYNTESASSAGINLSSSVHGPREFIMPLSSLLTPGEYWFALAASTSSAGAGGAILNLSNLAIALQTFNRMGVVTNATNSGWLKFMGHGTYSATTASMPAGISMTQINQLGTMPILFAATGTV